MAEVPVVDHGTCQAQLRQTRLGGKFKLDKSQKATHERVAESSTAQSRQKHTNKKQTERNKGTTRGIHQKQIKRSPIRARIR